MLIPEPTGLVCLDCRTDEAGLVWPAATYAQFTSAADLWEITSEAVGS
jgi:hypothetical protein